MCEGTGSCQRGGEGGKGGGRREGGWMKCRKKLGEDEGREGRWKESKRRKRGGGVSASDQNKTRDIIATHTDRLTDTQTDR